jgi:preprotein translocase subunit YajC
MMIQLLQAAQGAAEGQSGKGMGGFDPTMIIMLVALFAIMYFFMIRPQQKKQKEIQKFRNSLTVGTRVVTGGGLYGTIKELNEGEAYVTIEIAKGVTIQVDRNYVFADVAQSVQK